MKVMFDANILLDVFQNRQPYYRDSAFCISEALKGTLDGWIPAHVVTTFYYLLEKHADKKTAREAVEWLLANFQTAPCDHMLLTEACASEIADLEDAVVALSAARVGRAHVVTRNSPDFSGSTVPAVSPMELIKRLKKR
jgi:predicted nucleic acid-binding protein